MNPSKLKPYIKADDIRLDRKNWELWLQGAYFFDAITLALGNALRGKREKAVDYPDKPRKITRDTPEEREARAQQEREKAIRFFQSMERKFKAKAGDMSADGRNAGN